MTSPGGTGANPRPVVLTATVPAMTEPPRCLATVPSPDGQRPCRARVWRDGVCWHHLIRMSPQKGRAPRRGARPHNYRNPTDQECLMIACPHHQHGPRDSGRCQQEALCT
jgi:hypothetical protein